jgi:nucleoside-diphosphate-sugar epimerase
MDESFPINPVSYYAETKLEAEEALKKEQSSIHLLILRLFNHTHKSQDPSFFLPSLYHQILKGMSQIKTGNLDLERDFAAVQDLTSALNSIIQSKMTSSGIFNICSGIGKNLKVLAAELAKQLDKNVTWSVDENLIRKNEPHTIVGSSVKFQEQFNWQPKYSSNEHELIKNFLKEL